MALRQFAILFYVRQSWIIVISLKTLLINDTFKRRRKMKKIVTCTALFTLSLAVSSVSAAGLSIEEQMGRHVYMDKDLSLESTQSCATCHHRSSGFADPTNSRDPYNTIVSLGDDGVSKGGRNAPTSAYCGYSPVLYKDEVTGQWFGGMFWDGRKTGEVLGDPLAEQAQGPPLNPVEMNMGSAGDVVMRVASSSYAHLYTDYFGDDFFDVLGLDDGIPEDIYLNDKVNYAYDQIAYMIAAYERSAEVSPFDSKFDKGIMTAQEQSGAALFKANCAECHVDEVVGTEPAALFTNYGYVNIGVPENPMISDLNDDTDNDLGLGFVKEGEDGKFKIPTLRNIALTAPYSHNGYFATLEEMVRFHVNRGDLIPEIAANVVDPVTAELTENDITDIVAFLGALTDGSGMKRTGR